MVEKVIESNVISLNGVYYPIKGRVNRRLISTMPAKVVMGDYTLADEQVASTWSTKDQSGGMLCEEMDEATQLDRSYWSTSEGRYKGHLTLPTKATSVTIPDTSAGLDYPPEPLNCGFENDLGEWVGGSISTANPYKGAKHERLTGTVSAGSTYQDIAWHDEYKSIAFTAIIYCYVDSDAGSGGRIGINDGVDTTYSNYYETASYSAITVTKTLAANATRLRIILESLGTAVYTVISDFDNLQVTTPAVDGNPVFANEFNGYQYMGKGNILSRLDADGDEFANVSTAFAQRITDIVGPINNTLLIYLSGGGYYSMTTSQGLTLADSVGAYQGIIWDGKAFKMDTLGNMERTATPNAASPVWTDADSGYSLSNLGAGAVKSLDLYRDASGNYIIYAGTNQGDYAYDFADSMWLKTELSLPNHATSGMGAVHWRDARYVSAGLDVHKYIAGNTAVITQVGLNNDDGLPKLRGGEIVKLIKGYNEVFALVDSTYEGSTSISTVMSFDNTGWQCAWEAPAINKNVYSGIVSSVYRHALWFSTTDGVYYLTLQKNIRNPKKITSFPYGSTSVHISPWFDAGWVGDKLALSQSVFCKDTTTSETVGVLYRVDHTSTGLASTWVSLGTINNTGEGVETDYTFGTNAVGLVFKAIQFEYSLTGSSTKSPDVQYSKFKYLKLLDTKWGWAVTIDCNKEYDGNTPSQLMAALDTVVGTQPLVEFTYRNSTGTYTYYVKVSNASDVERTGEDFRGIYSLALVQP